LLGSLGSLPVFNPSFSLILKGEAASLSDRFGLTLGLPAATAFLLKKQIQYRVVNGIGRNYQSVVFFFSFLKCEAQSSLSL
jgi:hypothetical protein